MSQSFDRKPSLRMSLYARTAGWSDVSISSLTVRAEAALVAHQRVLRKYGQLREEEPGRSAAAVQATDVGVGCA